MRAATKWRAADAETILVTAPAAASHSPSRQEILRQFPSCSARRNLWPRRQDPHEPDKPGSGPVPTAASGAFFKFSLGDAHSGNRRPSTVLVRD